MFDYQQVSPCSSFSFGETLVKNQSVWGQVQAVIHTCWRQKSQTYAASWEMLVLQLQHFWKDQSSSNHDHETMTMTGY